MHSSTTVRVSSATRDAVRELAAADGVSMDEEIERLARAERQRRMGAALGAHVPDEDELRWLDVSADTVADDARR